MGKSSSRSSVSFVSLGLVNLVVCYLGCGQLQHVCKNDNWKTFFILLRYDITAKNIIYRNNIGFGEVSDFYFKGLIMHLIMHQFQPIFEIFIQYMLKLGYR